jgi:hypothetical protein
MALDGTSDFFPDSEAPCLRLDGWIAAVGTVLSQRDHPDCLARPSSQSFDARCS